MTEYDDDLDYNSETLTDDDDDLAVSEDDGIEMEEQAHTSHGKNTDGSAEDKFLEVDELNRDMEKSISEVEQIFRISKGMCRILLNKFNWNMESLTERYYDNPDTDAFLRQCKVIPSTTAPLPASSIGECPVCCETAQLSGLLCHHWVCSPCWDGYLRTKITVDNTADIQCISNGCELLIEDEKVMSYLKSEQAKASYMRLMTNSYVESNKLIKWCPGTDCGKAVKVVQVENRPICCQKCKTKFCFTCAHEWHEPVNCRLLKMWLKKCSDDSETSNWINANTKECPKCHVTIEKDGGCNHVTCKNTACRMEFCWMCLGPWEPHGSAWYNCNRFDDTNAKKARDAQERSRAALQRYLHYYNRYMNHQQSLKLENKLYTTVKEKMNAMQQHSMSWIEVQFMRKAVDVLSESRKTLMYTYAFAYYLQRDNVAEIFEDNQKDLELATEVLSEFLERDMENENLSTLKQRVQDKYRYVEQRRIILLKQCQEGYDKETWKFTQ